MSNYYNEPRVSSSSLRHIIKEEGGSPKRFKRYMDNIGDEEKESKSLYRGRVIHQYCEDPNTFIVDEVDRPSDNICKIVDMIDQDSLPLTDEALDYCSSQIITDKGTKGVYQSMSRDKRLAKIKEGDKHAAYHNYLQTAKNHVMLSKQDKVMMDNVAWSLHNNPFANELLFKSGARKEEEVYWKYNNVVECKSLIDNFISGDGVLKSRVVDIKTTSKPINGFIPQYELISNRIIERNRSSFLYYKYYRQLAFYGLALLFSNNNLTGLTVNEMVAHLKRYYQFFIVCVETVEPYECKVFKISPFWIERGVNEINDAMEEIMYHQNTNSWDLFKNEGQCIEI